MQLPIALQRFTGMIRLNGECWEFTGTKWRGYGQISFMGKSWRVHRLSYHLTHGGIPSGLNVCHKCDNPSCINPDHLFVGTQSDNLLDCSRKGRNGVLTHPEKIARGERNGSKTMPHRVLRGENVATAKLTEAAVRWIIANKGKTIQRDMAAMFGVSCRTIQNIHQGTFWKHLRQDV